MAQLPPKIPNMTLCWSDLSDSSPPEMPCVASFSPNVVAGATEDPFWADEFHDFSSARRQAHRRSEAENEFERFDDEKFMDMFNNNDASRAVMAVTFSSSKSSSPSDYNDEKEITNQVQHHSMHKQNEDQQNQLKIDESDEVENQISKRDKSVKTQPSNHSLPTPSSDKIIDPKRVKRILANRQSAQRSRVRKLQYIIELERSVTSLQAEVSVLSPRVALLDQQRLLLNVDNGALKQRIAALAQDKIFKDAVQDGLKREIERLRQVYQQQNLNNLEYVADSVTPSPNPQCYGLTETEQLLNV